LKSLSAAKDLVRLTRGNNHHVLGNDIRLEVIVGLACEADQKIEFAGLEHRHKHVVLGYQGLKGYVLGLGQQRSAHRREQKVRRRRYHPELDVPGVAAREISHFASCLVRGHMEPTGPLK
jgi:hypothetical protein